MECPICLEEFENSAFSLSCGASYLCNHDISTERRVELTWLHPVRQCGSPLSSRLYFATRQ
ncbi:hypothetical protein BDN70DRAFT_287897 [Pholiota conissans]|uniref:Uncharacterized protein n=1 Tax=Pholiota conissans TaxID=109636 RepID=A0A9P5YT01_9AGAR|nr:hypothetical protein BDN70DRAFT_287897 [Pholiota conissans]